MAKVTEIRDLLQSNVRASEGAGTTTLTNSDARRQIFNLSAARTVQLPTTGVQAGDVWVMENQASGNFALTVQSSGANTLGLVNSLQASLRCTALQDAPTTAAHWKAELIFSEQMYAHGISYNGGNAPTVTLAGGGGSLTTVDHAHFIPYQVKDGTWRCKFNIRVHLSSTSRTSALLAVNGMTFNQAGAVYNTGTGHVDNGGSNLPHNGVILDSSGISMQHGTQSTNQYVFAGDAPITNRPTWAY